MPWVREGECNRCGDCCKSGDPFNGEQGVNALFPGACPNLGLEDDGVRHKCMSVGCWYWENACLEWPTIPEHITPYPNCSFTFRWEEPINAGH